MLGCLNLANSPQVLILQGFELRLHIYKYGAKFSVVIRYFYLVSPLNFLWGFWRFCVFLPSFWCFRNIWRAVLHVFDSVFVSYILGRLTLQIFCRVFCLFLHFCRNFLGSFCRNARTAFARFLFLSSLRIRLFPFRAKNGVWSLRGECHDNIFGKESRFRREVCSKSRRIVLGRCPLCPRQSSIRASPPRRCRALSTIAKRLERLPWSAFEHTVVISLDAVNNSRPVKDSTGKNIEWSR